MAIHNSLIAKPSTFNRSIRALGVMFALSGVCFFAGMASGLRGAESVALPPSPLGKKVGDFRLHDFRGKEHALSEYADRKLVVVAFLGTDCPLAKLYAPRLAELAAEFEPQGVAFIGINSNFQDSLAQIGSYAQKHDVKFPLLKDPDNAVADQFWALRTPEVFLLDRNRIVTYHGAIDNQFRSEFNVRSPQKRISHPRSAKPWPARLSASPACNPSGV